MSCGSPRRRSGRPGPGRMGKGTGIRQGTQPEVGQRGPRSRLLRCPQEGRRRTQSVPGIQRREPPARPRTRCNTDVPAVPGPCTSHMSEPSTWHHRRRRIDHRLPHRTEDTSWHFPYPVLEYSGEAGAVQRTEPTPRIGNEHISEGVPSAWGGRTTGSAGNLKRQRR